MSTISYVVSEHSAERAIKVVERALNAAKNGNQAGENAVVKMAAAGALMKALLSLRLYHSGHVITDEDLVSRLELADAVLALAKDEWRSV